MADSREEPGLPQRLLSDPAMVEACRDRDFGKVFALAKRAGLYPSRIARRCDMTPSRVGEIISGRRSLTHIAVIERVADGLGIPGHMLGLARRSWEKGEEPASGLFIPPGSQRGAMEEVSPKGVALPSTDLEGILAIAAGPQSTPSTLRALQASIQDYWRRDDEHGGTALRPAVTGQLRYVLGLVEESRDGALRRGLQAVAAELARMAGWTHFDAREYSQARSYFTQALRLSREIDDRAFVANVLACLSLQATYEDKPADALALVTAAQDSVRGRGTPRVMAMLAMREAFAHATLRDRTSTHAAIGEAHRQFALTSGADDDPSWVVYFDETKLTVDTGIAHGQLGEASAAEPLIAQALSHEPTSNQRGRAFHLFWLATSQLQNGNLDEACNSAEKAVTLASSVDSQRVAEHLRDFRKELHPYRNSPQVVAFEQRMSHALP
ncbi:helix-turn-helix domain-containing protein [Streptomyces sp. OE57]|uniref:helix-turn-helix domain-containing protein n=1 Tax=Streptomyces lacaronensis TaxID=3379885 RepID=UPI0039B75D26